MPDTLAAATAYDLHRLTFANADSSRLREWESYRTNNSFSNPLYDPVWLRGYFAGQLEKLDAYMLYGDGSLCGVVPFLLKQWPLRLQLGEISVAKLPLTRLRLLGGTLNLPEDITAYDLLFRELMKAACEFDVIQLEEVPIDSFLWDYLQTSPLIRTAFRRYVPDPPTPHLYLRFETSFEQYMKKFSAKHRHNLKREVKRIREGVLGPMRFVRYTQPDEVDSFLIDAVELSKKTYQWNLHQRGLSATDLLRQRMLFAAQHGWLRSYMLFCNDIPCAFTVGFQHDGVFLLQETGFDPSLSKYSVGMVLQMLTVEDLFAQHTPQILDLASYGGWKEVLATGSYLESKVLLFKPGAYTRCVRDGHRIFHGATKTGAALLERLELKSRVKKTIRALSTRRANDQTKVERNTDA